MHPRRRTPAALDRLVEERLARQHGALKEKTVYPPTREKSLSSQGTLEAGHLFCPRTEAFRSTPFPMTDQYKEHAPYVPSTQDSSRCGRTRHPARVYFGLCSQFVRSKEIQKRPRIHYQAKQSTRDRICP